MRTVLRRAAVAAGVASTLLGAAVSPAVAEAAAAAGPAHGVREELAPASAGVAGWHQIMVHRKHVTLPLSGILHWPTEDIAITGTLDVQVKTVTKDRHRVVEVIERLIHTAGIGQTTGTHYRFNAAGNDSVRTPRQPEALIFTLNCIPNPTKMSVRTHRAMQPPPIEIADEIERVLTNVSIHADGSIGAITASLTTIGGGDSTN